MIGPLSFPRGRENSEAQDWVDPFIGLRTSADVLPNGRVGIDVYFAVHRNVLTDESWWRWTCAVANTGKGGGVDSAVIWKTDS